MKLSGNKNYHNDIESDEIVEFCRKNGLSVHLGNKCIFIRSIRSEWKVALDTKNSIVLYMQITDGTICYVRLNKGLDSTLGDVVALFNASSCKDVSPYGDHYVTDGPFMFRSKTKELFMIWSSFIDEKYAEFIVKFKDGKLGLDFEHLKPLLDSDGGHGMIFSDGQNTYFTYHTPNKSGYEHPEFCLIEDDGDFIKISSLQ